MDPILKEKQIAFFENCESFYGMNILINANLSRNKNNFDRHFTTMAFLKFELKNVGVRTSGAKATFRGAIQYYEIGVGEIISLEKKNEKEYHFLEKYSETIYRLSIIKFEEIS